jgi:hypothetical protein
LVHAFSGLLDHFGRHASAGNICSRLHGRWYRA